MHTILNRLEKTRFEAQAATMEDLFPFLLVPAVLLVALEALLRIVLIRRFP
jgi:Ca-activated chloride channel family protein